MKSRSGSKTNLPSLTDPNDDPFLNHLSNICQAQPMNIKVERTVTIRVAEARGLQKDLSTYVEVYVEERPAGRTLAKKSQNPFWGQEIKIELEDDELIMHLILNKENNKKGGITPGGNVHRRSNSTDAKPTEIGRATINLDTLEKGENWYPILSKAKKTSIDLRINIAFEEITILSAEKYHNLLGMLLDEESEYRIITLLSTKPKDAVELAELICLISEAAHAAPNVLSTLLNIDIKSVDEANKETLFRENSVGTKALDFYMKLVGRKWLDCLSSVIGFVRHSEVCCEVRVRDDSPLPNAEENLNNLRTLYESVTKYIFDSAHQCPHTLRLIFSDIQRNTKNHLGTDKSLGITAITGFIFLRFFVPAIMTPKLFGLSDDYACGNSEVSLKLIATMLQKVANLQQFEARELHLDKLNDLLERDIGRITNFVEQISTPINESSDTEEPTSVSVKPEYDLPRALARMCQYIKSNQEVLEQALPDKHVVKFLTELSILYEEMDFLGKKFKSDQKKRIAEARAVQQQLAEQLRRKRSFSLGLRTKEEKVKYIKELHFPEYVSIPPYTRGDVPDYVDDYVQHLLETLEQARKVYESLQESKRK